MGDNPLMAFVGVLAPEGVDGDGACAERAGRGEGPAFARLVERHGKDALAVAIGLVRDRSEAEEAVQEAFCRAWRSIASLRDPAKFKGWFSGILYRVCCDLLRARQRDRRALPELGRSRPTACLPGDSAGPVLAEALELPDEYRDPLVLFHVQGLTIAELAAALGLSESNAKVRLHRGRKMLRERLERKGLP
jgi:RNA polymerase sigma-70 factor (ECF subfamily)